MATQCTLHAKALREYFAMMMHGRNAHQVPGRTHRNRGAYRAELCVVAPTSYELRQLSIHQPSRTLKLGTPFRAAFIPVVLEASCGPCGVFNPAFPLFVMGPEDCFDLIAQVLYVPEFVIRAFVTA